MGETSYKGGPEWPNRGGRRGRLKLFFGYAPGSGKTYAMLDDALDLYKGGTDVLVGCISAHAFPETEELLKGLPCLIQQPTELDLDAALKRRPALIVIDDIARKNPDGSRNKMRCQDVEELQNAGIDVYATLGVEQIESLNELIAALTGQTAEETIPDGVFDNAEQVTFIDIDPEDLMRRLQADQTRALLAEAYASNTDTLRRLREIALHKAADRVSRENLQQQKKPAAVSPRTKFLVCIGPSPSSASCIRWAVGVAQTMHAPIVALYVEKIGGRGLTEAQKQSVREHLLLAERMGAECVTLNGSAFAPVIAEYAALSGVTDIVVGKSRNKRTVRNLFELDFEDQLIALLPGVEVHIIPNRSVRLYHPGRRKLFGETAFSFAWKDVVKTLFLLALATLISYALREAAMYESNIVVYILSVIIISRVTSGYLYGVAASIISVLLSDFVFTYPYYVFTLLNGTYPVTFLIMLIVALITSALTVRIKTQANKSVEREWRTQILYEINKKLLATQGLLGIADVANSYAEKLFERSVIFYAEEPDQAGSGVLLQSKHEPKAEFLDTEKGRAVARWVFLNHKSAGKGTDTFAEAEAFYMPVSAQGRVAGVMGVSCQKGPLTQDNRLLLSMMATQVAMALERQRLSDEQGRILLESEKEKMRSNLLRAISHDLRTPLTGISGASSAILENGDKLDRTTHDMLVSNIRDDAQWLIRMVENLLSVTRINEEETSVKKTTEVAEEVVAEAVRRFRKRYPRQTIQVKAPEELLLVPMDGTLIEQVLINLMENALKHAHTESPIELEVSRQGGMAAFEVRDYGSGIAREELSHLFTGDVPIARRSSDATRGMGIGLSICMTIVKAHQGVMEAYNLPRGGAAFRFTLPLESEEMIVPTTKS